MKRCSSRRSIWRAAQAFRAGMGFFRDRRPDLYAPLLTSDGRTRRILTGRRMPHP